MSQVIMSTNSNNQIMSDLAVVICHGSYHTPAPYMPLVDSLKAVGIDTYCPQLPTSDLTKLDVGDPSNPDFDREPPSGGYPQGPDDTKTILGILNPLILKGKRVLIVGHSAGGWVATEVAKPELQEKARKAQGLAGGILGIFYIGAFIVPVGRSMISFLNYQPKDGSFILPPFLELHKPGWKGLATPKDAEKFFFSDLEPKAAQKWAATLTASPPLLTAILSNDAYAAFQCAYLILEGDTILPKGFQEAMVGFQAQRTGNFTLYRCSSGHSPHLSWTDGTTRTIREFIEKIEN